MTEPDMLDCLIVGGGPAGLMAAVYLGRFRRRTTVIDEGRSRLTMIPKTRNVMGFPEGIAGTELLERMRAHTARFGAATEMGRVDRLECLAGGGFAAWAGSTRLAARFVILATGARDVEPDVSGLPESLKAGRVRYCPVCDGFETQGQRVAVLGKAEHGLRESAFVAGFDNEVTWLTMGTHRACSEEQLADLEGRGVRIVDDPPRRIRSGPEKGVEVDLQGGGRLEFDVLYPALGLVHASALAIALGAKAEEDGQLVVDDRYQTTVPGLYAAGDVAVGLNQINVAAGQAAIAATAIHNCL